MRQLQCSFTDSKLIRKSIKMTVSLQVPSFAVLLSSFSAISHTHLVSLHSSFLDEIFRQGRGGMAACRLCVCNDKIPDWFHQS